MTLRRQSGSSTVVWLISDTEHLYHSLYLHNDGKFLQLDPSLKHISTYLDDICLQGCCSLKCISVVESFQYSIISENEKKNKMYSYCFYFLPIIEITTNLEDTCTVDPDLFFIEDQI